MLLSKEHVLHVKKLYKIIFQLHKSLPSELKDLGDAYVRNEFKLHKSVSPDIAGKFLAEWRVSIYLNFVYKKKLFFLLIIFSLELRTNTS